MFNATMAVAVLAVLVSIAAVSNKLPWWHQALIVVGVTLAAVVVAASVLLVGDALLA